MFRLPIDSTVESLRKRLLLYPSLVTSSKRDQLNDFWRLIKKMRQEDGKIKELLMESASIAPKRPLVDYDPNKTYEQHVILIPLRGNAAVFEEFSYKEDAIKEYFELESKHPSKVILAKVVRQHGEG